MSLIKLQVIQYVLGEGSSWPVQGLLRHFKKEIEKRNNLDLIVEKKNTVPYLVDQHLLDKKNA